MNEETCGYEGCTKYGRAHNKYGKYCEVHVRLVMGFYSKGNDKIVLPNDYKVKEENWIQAAVDRSSYPKRDAAPRYPKRTERR